MTDFTGGEWRSLVDGSVVSDIPDEQDLKARYDWTQASGTSTVVDQTGHGNDITGSYTGPTANINGLQAGEFDGSNDLLDIDWANQSQPNHVFVVYQYLTSPSGPSAVFGGASDGPHKFGTNNNGDLDLFAGKGNNVVGGSATTSVTLASALFNGSNSVLRIDGSQVASGDAGSQDAGGFTVGSQAGGVNYANVAIGEVLFYPQDKTGIQSGIESYLAGKWGVTL